MPLKSEPHLLADPVSAFFSGFTSVFARMLLGGIAIGCGLAVGAFSGGTWFIFAIFNWAERGAWFVLGLATLISIFVGLWVFIHGSEGRTSFFFIFSIAALHFSPALFPPDGVENLLWTVGIYGIATACYWLIPRMIAAFASRHAEDEIETAAPIPEEEYHTNEEAADTDAGPVESNEYPPTGADPLEHPADDE